ncbi:hypothetical protein [Corynebacterium sp. Marseille-P3884]|uniref:hypothetical protein n=1 Tax=Corynebacterium sp. Marseille-P3884 TaxID=2495409 RepID=UPI001B31AA8E|nr:hypothetical protein [Corynebacterium sp. Marseille-P3884]MBP3949181.1 hypothetical protein [Corynebacterium sp. Marseille-P3884]
MPLPDLTDEEKQAIIQALQEANVNWPGFQPEAKWYKDFLVVRYWCPEFDTEPDFVVIGHGPAIVDTRDNSVVFYGSVPVGWTDAVFADDFPHGVVQLSDEPIPGCPKIKREPIPAEEIRATPRNTRQGLRRREN